MEFHIRITKFNDQRKKISYIPEGGYHSDRTRAKEAAELAFHTTQDVILVEVFQSGIANPIAIFQ